MKSQKSLSLDQEIWSEIDKRRGDVPRSRFLALLLADVFGISKKESKGDEQE